MIEKKVRIVSLDKRYRKEAYPSIPIFNSKIGTYETGQHINPADPTTKDNLTTAEMLGEVMIPAEKLKKFPHIIVPEVRVPIEHLRQFNLSTHEDGSYVNPKDVAEFNLIKQFDFVAPTKAQYKTTAHYFYIEDLQAEATIRVNARELRFRAEKLVRENATVSKYKDLAILLNYKIPSAKFLIDNMSELMIQDKLFDACETNPNAVISCFADSAHEDLFILKAAQYGIITRKGASFYDNEQFLGDSVEEVKRFIRKEEGMRYKIRWGSHIAKRENKEYDEQSSGSQEARFKTILSEIALAIVNEDKALADSLYEQALMINADSQELTKIKGKIDLLDGNKPPVVEPRKQYSDMNDAALKIMLGKQGVLKAQYINMKRDEMIAKLQELDPR